MLVFGNNDLSVVRPVFECHVDRAVSGVDETSFPKLYQLIVLVLVVSVTDVTPSVLRRVVAWIRNDNFDDLRRGSDRSVCA